MKNLHQNISRIKNLMGFIYETKISDLPIDIQKSIQKMETDFGLDITDDHIEDELEQEGNWQPDSGGEDPKARKQIEKLISDARQQFGSKIPAKAIVSGYRSYQDQVRNFGNKAKTRGVEKTQTSNAIPGFSEHHNGKTFDIFSVETSWWNQNSEIKDWVANNCDDYGFKVTYKSKGPLRIAEPWHLTYVGGEKGEVQKISDQEVDAYFWSPSVDEKKEKQIEKQYPKKNCKASSNYTESPSLDKVESGDEMIRIGHKGDSVEELQKKLYDLGYDLGPCGIDGIFGIKTKRAIESFQEDKQIEVSSSLDKETLEKLLSKTSDKSISKKIDKKKEESKPQEKTQDKSPKGSYSESKENEYLIYEPKNFKGGEAHVLFAGANSYRGKSVSLNPGFYGKGVEPIKGKVLVVITHWNNSVPRVQEYLTKKYGAKITSIAGFSKGGRPLWDYVGPKSNMKFVGLIDPSPEGEGSGINPYIDLDFGSNTYMVANWKNWGDKPPGFVPSKVLKWYCDHKNDPKYKGKVECTDSNSYDHSPIFMNFYNKFGSRI